MPDPKLKVAAEEIKAVLLKHDIAAVVTLASESHMEFILHVVPSWSCAFIEGNHLRVRAKRADFPDEAAHKKCLEDTIGMFLGFMDVEKMHVQQFDGLLRLFAKTGMDAQHYTRFEGGNSVGLSGKFDFDKRIADMRLWAWVGEDELGSGQFGLKQAIVPGGCIPMVACVQGRMEHQFIKDQLTEQARKFGKTISLVRFCFERVEAQVP